jgi:TolA-binding protein
MIEPRDIAEHLEAEAKRHEAIAVQYRAVAKLMLASSETYVPPIPFQVKPSNTSNSNFEKRNKAIARAQRKRWARIRQLEQAQNK